MPERRPKTPRRLVTLTVAAESLGTSTKFVRRRIAEGRLTGYRLSTRAIRVDMVEVEALAQPMPNAATA